MHDEFGRNAPNLDAMTPGELRTFFHRAIGVRPIKVARELFSPRREGIVKATCLLRAYADNKAVAMEQRVKGEIQTALIYEGICEGIYARLPEWARW